jgi:hypothetical protein
MRDAGKLDRRAFTARSVMAMLGGVVVTISGCGGGGPGAATGSSPVPASGGVNGNISSNHGHRATITAAQLTAGAGVTLSIRGDANHEHSVDLTADEVLQIAGGQRVLKRSSNEDSHFHEVTFN